MNPARAFFFSLLFALAGSVRAAEPAPAADPMLLVAEAAQAAAAGDFPGYLAKMEAAFALRPDFPQVLFHLAAAQTANERPEDAVATLQRLAALGLSLPVADADEFAALRERPDFLAVVKTLAANARPKGRGETAFAIREITGLIEGIAWREKTGGFYFGDVNARAVWVRPKDSRDGKLRRLTPESEEVFGIFALAIDEAGGALWAATSAVPAMSGFSPELAGTAGLAEFDLESGALRRTVLLPGGEGRGHLFADLAVGPDGTIYLADGGEPGVWQLAPGGTALEQVVASEEFALLDAIASSTSGTLIVADRINGLFRVDPAARTVRRLEAPADATLVGIGGLAFAPNGDLLAIQNSTAPKRVLRLKLDPSGDAVAAVAVLESGHLTLGGPSLGCIATGGEFFFIGNAGWSRFDGDNQPTAPRPVPVFKTKL